MKYNFLNHVTTALLASVIGIMPVTLGQAQEASPVSNSNQVQTIATTLSHDFHGYQATTLYVRSIPVLTFLGARIIPNGAMTEADDSTARAKVVADRINQLSGQNIDANQITLYRIEGQGYVIKYNETELAVVNAKTFLPDTTKILYQDALQVTNRLRRLIGGAAPLATIEGDRQNIQARLRDQIINFNNPTTPPTQNQEPTRQSYVPNPSNPDRYTSTGIASWYGGYFHGRRTASGAIYNQNAMTAAHKTLPFGTYVLVTNLNNGKTTVVKITDRGPFIRGRIIDLSRAAAGAIDMIGSGIARVRIEVIDPSEISNFQR